MVRTLSYAAVVNSGVATVRCRCLRAGHRVFSDGGRLAELAGRRLPLRSVLSSPALLAPLLLVLFLLLAGLVDILREHCRVAAAQLQRHRLLRLLVASALK